MNTEQPINATTAEQQGFTVDRHCYPWFAYKGPRFAPTETIAVTTDTDPASFKHQLDQAQAAIRELLTLLDRYTEAGGIMWCIVHDGVADETNTGDICDMSDNNTNCQLVRLYYRAAQS